ncbi:hypothetical protein Syun_004403 [Stephania yunnanensis]|uniref:Uncharacterized protein n=1 Tax=Stephania yunnanensis TaxID=152371 RepID=A0AAP0L3E3_9MAGN
MGREHMTIWSTLTNSNLTWAKGLCYERLDSLFNTQWIQFFSSVTMEHVAHVHLDHSPYTSKLKALGVLVRTQEPNRPTICAI